MHAQSVYRQEEGNDKTSLYLSEIHERPGDILHVSHLNGLAGPSDCKIPV